MSTNIFFYRNNFYVCIVTIKVISLLKKIN